MNNKIVTISIWFRSFYIFCENKPSPIGAWPSIYILFQASCIFVVDQSSFHARL